MSDEKIGLQAVLEDKNFQDGVKRYLDGINQMNSQTANATSTLGSQFSSLGSSVLNFAGIIGTVAVGAVVGLATAIGSFVASGVGLAADLEAQMDGVQAILGATAEDMARLDELATDLGIDPNLKVSSVEAAQAIEMLARNGLGVEEIMTGAARGTVLLANATGGEFSQSADIATDVMALFGIESSNMSEAVNGITSVMVNSKFTLNDYALALAQGGGVAASVGVEFADFNTTIAAISPLFGSGSDAGTSFKTFLSRLVPASKTAEAAMYDLGLITADGANQFFDAGGNMKSMSEIAGVLASATADLSEEQRIQALSTIFGSDAIRAANGIARVGAEGFLELQSAMGQTDAAEQAAIRVDNLKGAMEILDGVMETVRLQIGKAFLPVLTQMARSFSSFVDRNSGPIIAFFQNAANGITAFFDAILDGEGILDIITGAFESMGFESSFLVPMREMIASVMEFGTAISTFIAEHWNELMGAFIAVGALLASSALIPIISGIGAALVALTSPISLLIGAVALLGAAWAGNWGGIRDVIMEIWTNSLQPALTQLWEWLQVVVPQALQFLSNYWTTVLYPAIQIVWAFIVNTIIPLFGELITWLQATIPQALQTLSDFWTNILKPAIEGVWAWMNDTLFPLLNDLWTWLQTTIPQALQTLSDFWTNTLRPAIEGVWSWLDGTLFPFLWHLMI